MFAAVSLGVFRTCLGQVDATVDQLAQKISAEATTRSSDWLDACVGLGLLARTDGATQHAARKPLPLSFQSASYDGLHQLFKQCHVADVGQTRRCSPRRHASLAAMLWLGWSDLPHFFFRDEAAKREFLMGMHGFGVFSSPQVVSALDLSRFQCLADLGGATGHLAIAACERYPNHAAIVFDLPAALPLATEIVGQSKVSDRIELVGATSLPTLCLKPICMRSAEFCMIGAKIKFACC